MTKKNPFKEPTRKQFEAIRRPYQLAIGRVALTWNGLQDSLALLFWTVIGVQNGNVPFALWHCIRSDRSQREMLKAAVTAVAWPSHFPQAKTDIMWLLDQIEKYEDRRNDALHSPFVLKIWEQGRSFEPIEWNQNPRAKKLRGKDVLAEFKWYADAAETLHMYSRSLYFALSAPGFHAWPDRPNCQCLPR
jgi:hypothetical protein